MSYLPSPKAPPLSRAQAARMDRWWEWRRQRDAIYDEAFSAYKRGDMDEFLRLDAEAKAIPEPDIFNG